MSSPDQPDPNRGLERQGLKRALMPAELKLADGLERIFQSGVKDYAQVALLLQQNGVQLPSGAAGPWTVALLETELKLINASLDRAYEGVS